MMRKMVRKESGFTLIELLTVLAIIGIIAAIAVPIFASVRETSVCATVKSDARNAAMAALAYAHQNNDWDVAMDDIADKFRASTLNGVPTTVRLNVNTDNNGTIQVTHQSCGKPYTFCQSNGSVVEGTACP